jgi:hypothetical protein
MENSIFIPNYSCKHFNASIDGTPLRSSASRSRNNPRWRAYGSRRPLLWGDSEQMLRVCHSVSPHFSPLLALAGNACWGRGGEDSRHLRNSWMKVKRLIYVDVCQNAHPYSPYSKNRGHVSVETPEPPKFSCEGLWAPRKVECTLSSF